MLIHITLGPERQVDPEVDELGRSRVGFAEDMDSRELYEANHGCWKLGSRAHHEQFVLVSFDGLVKQAVEIESIDPVPAPRPGRESRRVIHGRVLVPGDAVHDLYVGGASPVIGVRNPITYVDLPEGRRRCACGCGGEVGRGLFLSGHDQRAVHERVARVGSVVDFLDWFDVTFDPSTWHGGRRSTATREAETRPAVETRSDVGLSADDLGAAWSQRIPGGGYALRNVVVARSLDDLRGPVAGRFRLPLHLDASARAEYDLADPHDRDLVYRIVLLEAARESDHAEWLDRNALVREWRNLHLPQVVRSAWEGVHPELRPAASAPDLMWH